jgi:hypothetical protein
VDLRLGAFTTTGGDGGAFVHASSVESNIEVINITASAYVTSVRHACAGAG